MRKYFILPCIILLACSALNAQKSGVNDITVSNLKLDVVNDYVEIRFTAKIADNAAKSSYTFFAVPTLTNNSTRLPLAPIVVQGKRAQVAEKRYSMALTYPGLGQPVYAVNGEQIPYSISIPYESWMSNVNLVMDKYERGCCNSVVLPSSLVAQNIALSASPKEEPVWVEAPPAQQIIDFPVQNPVVMPVVVQEPVIQMPVIQQPIIKQPVVVQPAAQIDTIWKQIVLVDTIRQQVLPEKKKPKVVVGKDMPRGKMSMICPPESLTPPPLYIVLDEEECLDESYFSTADKLRMNFTFVSPIMDYHNAQKRSQTGVLFDYNMPLNLGRGISRAQQSDLDLFIDENRDSALSIYFKQGSDIVDRVYADNGYALVDMISCIRAIQSSKDSRIVKIIIAGFASPEGTFLFNDRLAWERAVAVKEIILNNTNLNNRTISIYNGSVDWRGLYRLVADSDMYHKYQILNIIDLAPIVGDHRYPSRIDELKRLDRGEPYQHMLKHIFPYLRQAAYIKIYYENINNTYVVMP